MAASSYRNYDFINKSTRNSTLTYAIMSNFKLLLVKTNNIQYAYKNLSRKYLFEIKD